MEEALTHTIGRDFICTAKDDGEVVDKDDNFLVVKYKDGTNDVINLDFETAKNGGETTASIKK